MRRSSLWFALLSAGCTPAADLALRKAPQLGLLPTTTPSPTSSSTTDPTSTPATFPTTPTQTSPDGDPWAVVADPPPLSPSVLDYVASAIDDIVQSTSATTGIYIVDAENGQVVYAQDEDSPKTPASNTKLFTTAVAFDLLGEDYRLPVTAWGDALPDIAGAVDTVTVVGEHDFTWSTYFYETSSFPAERLADQLWDAGVRSVAEVTVSGQFEVEGYSLGYFDEDYHRDAAADTVWVALEDRGIAVADVTTDTSLVSPATSVLLASRGSPPLSVACHPLLVYSHNEFADLLGLHDGWVLWGEDSYEAGGVAIEDWLDGIGIDTTGLELHDGSGLSHDNAVTPRQIVEMEAYLFDRPSGIAWQRSFSTAGVLGTLGSRMTGEGTAGRFLGKTGTLSGVIATSGVLYHATDGHRYLVSILMNNVADDTYARELQDNIVEVIASDLRDLGERPTQPALTAVRSPGDGTLVLSWEEVADADGYAVWLSTDGLVWRRTDARYVDVSPFVAGALLPDTTYYARITALNGAGESEPSDVLAARAGFEPPEILLVSGDDRWALQWENPMGRGHDFLVAYAAAMGDHPFESVVNEAVADGTVILTDYGAVLWQLGEESSEEETFDDLEQVLIADAVAKGTGLLASGAEIAWDLGLLGYPSDITFLQETLGIAYVGDDAQTWSAEPVAGGLFDGLGELGFYTPGTQVVDYPDQIAPVGGAEVALDYIGGTGGAAAVVTDDGARRVVVLGFPFESIDSADQRALLMERIVSLFDL